MNQYTPEQVEKIADHLTNGTPNWFRESFGDWKDAVHTIDRAPKDAAAMLRAYAATLRQPSADSGRVGDDAVGAFLRRIGGLAGHALSKLPRDKVRAALEAALAAQGQGEEVVEVTDSAGKFSYCVPGVLPAGTKLYTRPDPAASPAELAAEYTRGRSDGWEAAKAASPAGVPEDVSVTGGIGIARFQAQFDDGDDE